LKNVVRLGYKNIIIFPYFLFSGVLVTRIKRQSDLVAINNPHISFIHAKYLSSQAYVVDTFVERIDEILNNEGNNYMNCSTCKYRSNLFGFEKEVGMVQESHHDHVEGLGISCDLCDPECNGACEIQNQIPTHNQEKSNSGGGDYLEHEPKNIIVNRWGKPSDAIDLDNEGFSINGIKFGKITLLIQPQRGYDAFSDRDIHSPDLPPPHRYLAQYFWIEKVFNANAMCHIGKHGTVEWLPGKSIGLSNKCFPNIFCPSIPNIYPFFVNDPGEGSQAKRRTAATIIDHLTPPLDRSELYGKYSILENYLDEYFEAKLLNSNRIKIIEKSIFELIKKEINEITLNNKNNQIEEIDSFLCKIKESQIRTGLHIFGNRQNDINEINLFLCIARVPNANRIGIVQYIAKYLELDLNPWTNQYDQMLSERDKKILLTFSNKNILNFRMANDFLEKNFISV